jgi:hypothetical protein
MPNSARTVAVRWRNVALAGVVALMVGAAALHAQMDLSLVSGQPLPDPKVPIGTMTVRVIRGSLTNNVAGQPVGITVDGSPRTITTDANGRAEVSGLKTGAKVKAVAVVDGERVESADITIGSTGIRVMLVAGLAAAPPPPAMAPAVPGAVSFGPESRIVAEFVQDRLNVYYLFDVMNPAQTAVDPGGPIIIDLPREARGASALQDSTKQGTVNGPRVTVVGPFKPGSTPVRVGFELPAGGGRALISSKLPAALPQLIVIVGQIGGMQVSSPQLAATREVTDEGQRIIVGTGPALPAGQTFEIAITGIPHHPTWPRYVALGLAGSIMLAGIWAAIVVAPRRRRP